MQWFRRDDLDELAEPERPFRSETIREIVDELPPLEQHVISRVFFGDATLLEAAQEYGVTTKVAREARRRALERIEEALLETDEVGPLPTAGPT